MGPIATFPGLILGLILLVLGAFVLVLVVRYLLWPICKGMFWLVRHLARFVFGVIGDTLRAVGAVLTMVLFTFLVVGNVVIGRWSASAHFGRAVSAELTTLGACLYRAVIGHPARLLLLNGLIEGIEQRVPAAMAAAPTRDTPTKRTGQFDGYTIVGSLKGGGSGGKLYVAEPDEVRRAGFERRGIADVDRVVIKSFSLDDGSSLPQIVRESRALDAARNLGLVLDHELTEHRFYYVMRYVPGEPLGIVTQRLHAESGPQGLRGRRLQAALTYAADLVETLGAYHRGGLWHKDVKPDNIIIHDGRAHVVDLGLVTPLRSAMTLTTHGTEYFRDPELVRMALRGVKVHQVDGAKFDVYAAGAVLFSMIENSFPAHGGLSQITRRCPDAVRWIVRRAMAEYDQRYASAAEMLEDLRAVLEADDPDAVKPAMLPSVARAGGSASPETPSAPEPGFTPQPTPGRDPVGTPVPPPVPGAGGEPRRARHRPVLRVANWWTGQYQAEGASARRAAPVPPRPPHRPGVRRSAQEQLASARARAAAAQARAQSRFSSRRQPARSPSPSAINPGVAAALFIFLGACVALAAIMINAGKIRDVEQSVVVEGFRGFAGVQAGGEPQPSPNALDIASTVGRRTVTMPYPLPTQDPTMLDTHLRLDGATFLVISDFRAPASDDVMAHIETGVNALRTRGARVLGVGAWQEQDRLEENHEQAIEWTARLRAQRGRRLLDHQALLSLMSTAESIGVDSLLWLEPMPPEDGGVRYLMINKDAESVASTLASPEEIPYLFGRTIQLLGMP